MTLHHAQLVIQLTSIKKRNMIDLHMPTVNYTCKKQFSKRVCLQFMLHRHSILASNFLNVYLFF